jgi:hypothetical protein
MGVINKMVLISSISIFAVCVSANDDVSIMDLKETVYNLMVDVRVLNSKIKREINNDFRPTLLRTKKRVDVAEKKYYLFAE